MTEHLQGKLSLSIAQKSIAGTKACNEDCIGIRVPEGNALTNKGVAAVIADGVSAAEAGKEASEASVQSFLSDYYSTPDAWKTKTSSHKVITSLNRWLYSRGKTCVRADRGFICTLSVLILKSCSGYIFHVGDTRIYRIRDNEIEQLTRDHVTDIAAGKQYLARALGMDLSLDIDYREIDLAPNDIYLLSSDGIHDYITDQKIKTLILDNADNLDRASETLIDAALDNNSGDNLSCQLLKIDALPKNSANDVYKHLTQLPFAPYIKVGMTLDNYVIEKELHSSRRSEVYLVRNNHTQAQHVMKVASQNFDDDPAYIERFIMEEWIGKRISNAHVVNVVDAGPSRSHLYYLTEHLPGPSLAQWLAENPKRSLQRLYPIIQHMIKAVTALHRLETLHQDIKPENLVFDKHGELKLIDFGSCLVGGLNEIGTVLERDFALGTLQYSAPEYQLGRKPGVQADFFSIGVICYQLLTGELPYGEKYAKAKTINDFLRLKYTPAHTYNPLVPIWVDGALKKMVSLLPESRYQEASEFLYDLEHPNSKFSGTEYKPLIEKNPLLTWQIISGVLLLGNLLLLYLLNT